MIKRQGDARASVVSKGRNENIPKAQGYNNRGRRGGDGRRGPVLNFRGAVVLQCLGGRVWIKGGRVCIAGHQFSSLYTRARNFGIGGGGTMRQCFSAVLFVDKLVAFFFRVQMSFTGAKEVAGWS